MELVDKGTTVRWIVKNERGRRKAPGNEWTNERQPVETRCTVMEIFESKRKKENEHGYKRSKMMKEWIGYLVNCHATCTAVVLGLENERTLAQILSNGLKVPRQLDRVDLFGVRALLGKVIRSRGRFHNFHHLAERRSRWAGHRPHAKQLVERRWVRAKQHSVKTNARLPGRKIRKQL